MDYNRLCFCWLRWRRCQYNTWLRQLNLLFFVLRTFNFFCFFLSLSVLSRIHLLFRLFLLPYHFDSIILDETVIVIWSKQVDSIQIFIFECLDSFLILLLWNNIFDNLTLDFELFGLLFDNIERHDHLFDHA